jgi:hypothetical protein
MSTNSATRYIILTALLLTILTPVTGAHANGALDNTFGNDNPKNGILTLAGSVDDNAIFNDLAAQGNKTIIVGTQAFDLIVVRVILVAY